jgi:transcriptional regulator with XRE-family HTH domain
MQKLNQPFVSSMDYRALGERLRAYRIGASLSAEEVAELLNVSRTVVYRLEKGEIVKAETLEKLAVMLGTSLASLLGVEVEYYSNVLSFIERMRQLEVEAERIVSHFEPVSLLLMSDEYLDHFRLMLDEAAPDDPSDPAGNIRAQWTGKAETLIQLLKERKAAFHRRRPSIVSLIGLREIEHFVHTGLVGNLNLSAAIRAGRIEAARKEIQAIAALMDSEPMHVQIGLVDDSMPYSTFQIFSGAGRDVLAVSPFRFGELPNVRNGIATVTKSPEAIRLYEEMVGRLWASSYKGKLGAQRLCALLDGIR